VTVKDAMSDEDATPVRSMDRSSARSIVYETRFSARIMARHVSQIKEAAISNDK